MKKTNQEFIKATDKDLFMVKVEGTRDKDGDLYISFTLEGETGNMRMGIAMMMNKHQPFEVLMREAVQMHDVIYQPQPSRLKRFINWVKKIHRL